MRLVVLNLQLIMPGYCVAGTIGHKVLSGAKKIEIDKKMVNVRLSVQYMSFRSVSLCLCSICVCVCVWVSVCVCVCVCTFQADTCMKTIYYNTRTLQDVDFVCMYN